ncbi:membrane organization and biogenesis-related protein [Ramicandelaber brevisporus]|nr:membrane organization and biogenesis-related protein [Ramicandelaber brevisporus]
MNATQQLQVIDEDQSFNSGLEEHMNSTWHLLDSGFDYNVVAVFGSQSTGKSTLLNRLFGTHFPVMHESQRQQTTKGIWMSKAIDSNTLIMDVEGTDGRERGENQDFERKSALFSLATSEVLIVNMWEHMVGLYNGANMGLLKTVFEVNLQLFQRKGSAKMLLLFVIRDHVGTPLDNLISTLKTDLERIWDGLAKPAGMEDCRINDYFDFVFTSLPHKILTPEKFDIECSKLKNRFTDKSSSDYVFKPQYHRRIPADGFPKYAEAIWEKIVSNRDLDLPTQQELLAQYRCDEISSTVFTAFQEASKHLKPIVVEAGKIVPDLGNQMKALQSEALDQFDQSASRYVAVVYNRKRTEHLSKVNAHLHVLFTGQLRTLYKQATSKFASTLQSKVSSGTEYNFAAFAASTVEDTMREFEQTANDLILPETDWTFTAERDQLRAELASLTTKFRDEEIRKLHVSLGKKMQKEIDEMVAVALSEPNEDMWNRVLNGFIQVTSQRADKLLIQRLTEYSVPKPEINSAVQRLHLEAWLILHKKIDDELVDNMVIMRLRNKLEELFRYDANGLPKVWTPEDDIDAHFGVAKSEAAKLLPLFERIDISTHEDVIGEGSNFFPAHAAGTGEDGSLDDFDLAESLIVLPAFRKRELTRRFQRESDALFLEAKRSIVSTEARVPYWTMILLAILGWNEFVALLQSPILLVLLLILGSMAYVVHSLGLSGQVQSGARFVAAAAVSKVHGAMVEAMNVTDNLNRSLADQQQQQQQQYGLNGQAGLKRRPSPSTTPRQNTEYDDGEDISMRDL